MGVFVNKKDSSGDPFMVTGCNGKNPMLVSFNTRSFTTPSVNLFPGVNWSQGPPYLYQKKKPVCKHFPHRM